MVHTKNFLSTKLQKQHKILKENCSLLEKIIWKSFLSFFLIWQSLFFGQSRADSSSFLKIRALQGNQSKANLKTSTQSYLFYFGSFGIGLTEIDIKNETDSFKYDMKDLS